MALQIDANWQVEEAGGTKRDLRVADFGRAGTPEDPVVVEAGSVATTNMTYTGGLLTSYVENGVTWTVARDGDGNITSITPAA